MNRLRHILSVLLVCLLICSMSVTAFAAGEQGGNSTVRANVPAAVTYDANGGSGTMEADSVAVGTEFTLPPCGFTAPGGKQFQCWEIGGENYAPGASVTVTDNMTVTAVWKALPATPSTGDQQPVLLWTMLLVCSGCAVLLLQSKRRRN